ncbi:MAG: Calx-beta domain-containing protein, partial [Mycobacterium sp.]
MGYGRFVGRVGALAVALGIGLAAPAVATADSADETSGGGASSDAASTRSEAAGTGSSETESTDDSRTDESPHGTTQTDDADLDDADLDHTHLDAGLDADLDDTDLDDTDLDTGLDDTDPVHSPELVDETELLAETELPEEADASDPPASAGDSASDLETTEETDDSGAPAQVAASDAEVPDVSLGADGGEAASRSDADPVVLTETLDSGDMRIADEPDIAVVAERNSGQDVAATDTEADSARTDGPAVSPAVLSYSSADPEPAATPEVAAPATGLAGIVSKFLAVLGIGPSAANSGLPVPTFDFVTVVLGAIRREIDRLFFNEGPSTAVSLSGQASPGIVTGAMNATDPEGDRLAYKVAQAPSRGSVVVDAAGNFTYTADSDLAATGGADTFAIQVRDTGFHLISTSPTRTEVPVTVAVNPTVAPAISDSPMALAAPQADSPTTVAAPPQSPMALAAPAASPDSSTFRTAAANASATTGTMYQITTSGPDIVDFDPTKDKLDLGDVSVHNFIVVDTPEGVGFRSPWTGDTAIVQGVSLGQLTVDSFAPVINDHLRQDLSGAMAWEHGVTSEPNTAYARSHEIGQIDRVDFNTATDVVDFRYYGSREQIYMTDSPEGVIISNAGTGQALILQGATKNELTADNFVFHAAQVREDALNNQLGIGPVLDSQVLPQGVPLAGTDNWPTAAGNGTPPVGETGTTTVIGWHWGTDTALDFDPAKDKLDFGWFQADNFEVTEQAGSTQVEIVNNSQTYTLNGVGLSQLQTNNIIALDNATRAKWQDLIFNALPQVPLPRLSVDDASAAEGDAGASNMDFTVRLSKASDDVVTASYTTSNGSATAAGLDYVPTVGTITFAPGETTKSVGVAVSGDTMVELDEQFTLNLSAPVNATIGDGIATGTIVNDDEDVAPATPPAVSIADLSVVEGDGQHSHFMFVTTLDKASTESVTVNYATADDTAVAGSDYSATSGTITFTPGVTTQLVHVDVHGDTVAESSETFTVTLSSPSGATIADGTAIGTITDDDTVVTDPVLGGGVNSGDPGDELWGEEH